MSVVSILWNKLVGGVSTPTAPSAADPLPVVQTGTPALPTGAATSARQILGGTAASPSTEVGTVQGCGTAGTPAGGVQSVQGVAGGTAQPISAGSGVITDLGAKADAAWDTNAASASLIAAMKAAIVQRFTASANFTRPNTTPAYTAGQVVGTSPATVMTFSNVARYAGGSGFIVGVDIVDENKTLSSTSTQTTLWLFSASPAAIADATNFNPSTGEWETLQASIGMAATKQNQGTSMQFLTMISTSAVSLRLPFSTAADRNLYGILQTTGTQTGVANAKIIVNLKIEN